MRLLPAVRFAVCAALVAPTAITGPVYDKQMFEIPYVASDVVSREDAGNTFLHSYFSGFCCAADHRAPSTTPDANSQTAPTTSALDFGPISGIIDMSIAAGFLSLPATPAAKANDTLTNAPGMSLPDAALRIISVAILPSPAPLTTLSSSAYLLGAW